MSGRQGGGFIEEEEFGVVAGSHQFPFTTIEIQGAGDPAVGGPSLSRDLLPVIVQTSAIAHERATSFVGDDVVERIDTVLKGHERSSTRAAISTDSTCFTRSPLSTRMKMAFKFDPDALLAALLRSRRWQEPIKADFTPAAFRCRHAQETCP
jgi:hypothetical protein